MIVTRLELVDFRNYATATFDFDPGITAVVGLNGQGKTNLAEALAYLATLDSFRGAPTEALIRVGADARDRPGRRCATTTAARCWSRPRSAGTGRNRVQVNRQKLGRTRDLLGVMRVSVFSPDDLALVKGGPRERRRFLDDTLVALARQVRRAAARAGPRRQAAQRAAEAGRRPPRRATRRSRSTCGTPS